MNEFGSIVLANSKKELLATCIKIITSSSWSHSLFTVPNCCGRQMGMEAASNGISMVPFDKAYRTDPTQGFRMYRLNVADEIKEAAIAQCLDDLESMYGYADLPWFIWRAINRLFGRDIKNQNNWASSHEICSQLVVKYITLCGLGFLFSAYGKNSIAPQDLQLIMDSNSKYFELIETKE